MNNFFLYILAELIVVAVLALSFLAIKRFFQKRKEQSQEEEKAVPLAAVEDIKAVINDMLSDLNTHGEWSNDGKEHTLHFTYQGGHFNINIDEEHPIAHLTFLFFYDTTIDMIDNVRTMINRCNTNTDRCRFVYTINNEEATINVHIQSDLIVSARSSAHELSILLNEIFVWRNIFIQHITQQNTLQRTGGLTSDPEKFQAHDGFLAAMLTEQLLAYQPSVQNPICTPQQPFTLQRLFTDVLDIHTWQPRTMTVAVPGQAWQEVPTDKIALYPLTTSGLLVVTFTDVSGRERRLNIDISKTASTNETRYYRITTTLFPPTDNTLEPEEFSFVQPTMQSIRIGVDVMEPQQQVAKRRYLWKEAVEAYRKGEPMPTDDNGQTVLFHPQADVFDALYLGSTLFHQKRFAEAIAPLRFVYQKLNEDAYYNVGQNLRTYLHICRMLAAAYAQTGQNEWAIFYNEIVAMGPPTLTVHSEFLRVLLAGHDARLMPVISNLETDLMTYLNAHAPNDDDDDDDADTDNYDSQLQLLFRVKLFKAHVFADRRQFVEAERLLSSLKNENDKNTSDTTRETNNTLLQNEWGYLQRKKDEHADEKTPSHPASDASQSDNNIENKQ